jgi:hypothetical protein
VTPSIGADPISSPVNRCASPLIVAGTAERLKINFHISSAGTMKRLNGGRNIGALSHSSMRVLRVARYSIVWFSLISSKLLLN